MKVPYQKERCDAGAGFLARADVELVPSTGDPEYLIGTGTCPRCSDKVDIHERIHVLEFYGTGSYAYRQYCTCEESHRGRPAEVKGCGAWWPVEVTWSRPDGR